MSHFLAAVMPTRNQAKFLPRALETVTPQVDALIVVNDASTDETDAIVRGWERGHPHVRQIICNERQRTHGAINTGIEECDRSMERGPDLWLTWVSSDNWHESHWRSTLERHFSPEVGAVYTAFWYERQADKGSVLFKPYTPERLVSGEACYYGPSFAIRSDVWARAGEHRGGISHDYDHWTRVEEACWVLGLRIVGDPTPTCHYIAHGERRTITERASYDAPHWRAEAIRRRGWEGRVTRDRRR